MQKRHQHSIYILGTMLFALLVCLACQQPDLGTQIEKDYPNILSHIVNPKEGKLAFYLKDNKEAYYNNFKNLRTDLTKQGKTLRFAMNGGMYLRDHSPQGLYIENGKTIKPLNKRQTAYGNFYLQPNGVFYLTSDNKGVVQTSKSFKNTGTVQYATQSGPMLVINGKIHPKFTNGSKNVHIRNGVGVLPDGRLLFAMSKQKINLYDFASFFKKYGCKNALYLDGFVSRTYLPEKNWKQEEGNFGVIIGQVQ